MKILAAILINKKGESMNLYYDSNKLGELFGLKRYKTSFKINTINNDTSNSTEFDINIINERLGCGDKDALKELEAQKVSYTLTENSEGYTVKYSYEGINYTITYYQSQANENKEENNDTENSNSINNLEDIQENSQIKEGKYGFDYSGINKDAKAASFNSNTDSSVDSGNWDELFAELEKIKPQIIEYIKAEVEAKGLVFDAEETEKYLNKYFTDAVKKVSGEVFISNKLRKNLTVEDLINYVMEQVDRAINKTEGNQGDANTFLNKFHASMSKNLGIFTEGGYSDQYADYDYLKDTADYFLSDEDKEMKFLLIAADQAIDNEAVYTTSDKEELYSYIDTYSKYLETYLNSDFYTDYYNFPKDKITELVTYAASRIKYEELPSKDNNGMYNIGAVLLKFKQICIEMIKDYNN